MEEETRIFLSLDGQGEAIVQNNTEAESICVVLDEVKSALLSCQKHYVEQLVKFCEGFVEDVDLDLRKKRRRLVYKDRHVAELVEFVKLQQYVKLLNQNLYADLRIASKSAVNRVLQRYSVLLEVYQDYVSSRISFLAILGSESRLCQHLEAFALSMSTDGEALLGLPLGHLDDLIACLQSFQCTDATFEQALCGLQRTQWKINDQVRRFANNAALKQVCKTWDKALTCLISSPRMFVKEATVFRVGGEKRVPLRLLLMSDLVALGIPQNRPFYRYKLRKVLPRSALTARALSETILFIEATDGESKELLLLDTSGNEEKDDWLMQLNNSASTSMRIQTCKLCLHPTASVLSVCGKCHRSVCERCCVTVKTLERTGLRAKVCKECNVVPPAPMTKNVDGSEQMVREKLILDELVHTERTYVEGLQRCWLRFCKPLIEDFRNGSFKLGSEVLGLVNNGNSASILVFLANVKQILLLHKLILGDLRELQVTSVASVFIKYGKLLKLYSEYAGSYSFSAEAFAAQASTSRSFRRFMGEDLASFQSLLISPIQRCPRYALMIKELLKWTDSSAGERNALVEALNIVEDINLFMNEHIRLRENLLTMFELETSWGAVVAGKTFVHQGDLLKISRKKNIEYRFLLFTDCMMYGKKNVESLFRFNHHRTIPLSECSVESSISEDDDGFVVHAKEKSFKVVAASNSAKHEWLSFLEAALEQRKNVQDYAPVWNQDTKKCENCKITFSVLNRRHHCRNCGKCVCNRCSKNERVLPFADEIKAKRVCIVCVEQLDKFPA